jgi:YD repeat-containing protein
MRATVTYYDGLGRPIQTRDRYHDVVGYNDWQDLITLTSYDARGNVSCQSVPYNVANSLDQYVNDSCTSKTHTTTVYDDQGRPFQDKNAANEIVATHIYAINDNNGQFAYNLLHHNVIDANQHRRRSSADARGNLVLVDELSGNCGTYWGFSCDTGEVAWAAAGQTLYDYDWQGNLTTVERTDGASTVITTTISYDVLGRKTSMDDPDMGVWSYGYDAAGNLAQQTDANGTTLCFYYDALNRPTTRALGATSGSCPATAPGESDVAWLATTSYDTATNGLGQPAAVHWAPDGTSNQDAFAYDSLGRVVSQTRTIDGEAYTVGIAYDRLSRPVTTTYPSGEVVVVSYDKEGEDSLKAGSDTIAAAGGVGKAQKVDP